MRAITEWASPHHPTRCAPYKAQIPPVWPWLAPHTHTTPPPPPIPDRIRATAHRCTGTEFRGIGTRGPSTSAGWYPEPVGPGAGGRPGASAATAEEPPFTSRPHRGFHRIARLRCLQTRVESETRFVVSLSSQANHLAAPRAHRGSTGPLTRKRRSPAAAFTSTRPPGAARYEGRSGRVRRAHAMSQSEGAHGVLSFRPVAIFCWTFKSSQCWFFPPVRSILLWAPEHICGGTLTSAGPAEEAHDASVCSFTVLIHV